MLANAPMDRNAFGNGCTQKFEHFRDHLRQSDRFLFRFGLTRESQNTLDNILGAVTGLEDLFQRFVCVRSREFVAERGIFRKSLHPFRLTITKSYPIHKRMSLKKPRER